MQDEKNELDVPSVITKDYISVTVTNKPHCLCSFEIHVKPEATEAAYHKAIKSVNKNVSLPGFRRGKAPDSFIAEKFSSQLHNEFVNLVLETAFNEAIHLTQIMPLKDGLDKPPTVHFCDRKKGAHFVVEFERRPIVPTIHLDEIQVEKIEKNPVTDESRQNALHNLALKFMTYEPVEDRNVQESDYIDLSITLLLNPPQDIVQNRRVEVSQRALPAWIYEKIIGSHTGQVIEGMTEQELSSETSEDFTPAPYQATIHAIWVGTAPVEDDELAKKVGLSTYEELQNKINERLEIEFANHFRQQLYSAVVDSLLEKYPVELPRSYVDYHKKLDLSSFLKRKREEGTTYSKEELAQVEKMIEHATLNRLKLALFLRKLAIDYQIEVNDEDISQELTYQLALMSRGESQIDMSEFNECTNEFTDTLQRLAFDRKMQNFLINHFESKSLNDIR